MNQKFLLSILATIIYLMATPVHAQWPTNHAVNVPISTATNTQDFQEVVSDGAGGAIITWLDFRNGTDYDIYAQRVTFDGQVLWSADGVAIGTGTGMQNLPKITKDNSGGAIITWMDSRSGNYKVYAQRINASGVVQWTANGVAFVGTAGVQNSPNIVSDGGGGAIITWVDSRNGATTGNDLFVQRLNASGVPQWTANGVLVCSAANTQSQPLITSDISGGAIITWIDERSGIGAEDIYAQRVSSTGTLQWTANGVAICTTTGNQRPAGIVPDGDFGAIIDWTDSRNGTDVDIYAQRINNSGVVQWTANGLAICTAAYDQDTPAITVDENGGAFIAWEDRRDGTCCNADLYAQHVNSTGTLLWAANGLGICTLPQSQTNPSIDTDGSGGAFISWGDYRGSIDVYAQHVNGAGASLWTPSGVPVCSATGDQGHSKVIQGGIAGGKAIFTWADRRGGTHWDIYAQGIVCTTAPGQPPSITGTSAICSGSTNTYSTTTVSDATSYLWTLPSGWTGTSTTTSIDATANSTSGNVTVAAVNGCGASSAESKAITVSTTPATPGTISGTTPICSGTNNVYSITAVAGATTYTWTLPGGWTGSSTTTSINTTASTTGGSITVSAGNTCGTSLTSSKAVVVNTPPATPGTINGTTPILVNTTNIYSITSVAGATSYTWTLPAGWTGTSTTTSITTTANTDAGTISVRANNACGSSSDASKAIVVNKFTQTITFTKPADVVEGAAAFNLAASSSSGLPVSFSSSNPAVATITGVQVTIVGAGSTVITASQAGNAMYQAATNVDQTLVVNVITDVEDPTRKTNVNVYPNPGDGIYEVHTAIAVKADALQLFDMMGRAIDFSVRATESNNVFLMNITQHKKGMYFLRVKGERGVVRIVRN